MSVSLTFFEFIFSNLDRQILRQDRAGAAGGQGAVRDGKKREKSLIFCRFPLQRKNRTTYLIKKILCGTEREDYLNEDPTGGGQKRVSFSYIPQNKNGKKRAAQARIWLMPCTIRTLSPLDKGEAEREKNSVDTGGGRRW